MAGQTLLWDSRIRAAVVVVPILGVMMWIASELASEQFIVPGVILSVFVVLVIFTVFVTTIRFETAVLCLLVIGYLVGNRGFADLTVIKPLYPGEFALAIIGICILCRFALTRELPDFSGWYARVIFIYCALGGLRLALDYSTYRLDAIRDSAMVYYAVFFFLGRQLASTPSSKQMLERCLAFSFVALVPLAVIERLAPDMLVWNGGFSPLFQKDDLLTTFAAMAVFIIYTRPKMYWNWLRVALILFYIVLVVSGVGRAALAALMVGSILIFIAGRMKFFVYPVVAVVLGLTVLGGFAAVYGNARGSDTAILVEKVTSMIDLSGQGNYASDYSEQKSGTNDFRRKLWQTFIDETEQQSPWFGRGFGHNFVVTFEETYQLGTFDTLRSAHNFYITLFGRMGWVGIMVFAVLTVQLAVGGIRAALAVKLGHLPVSDLAFWCGTWVILISSIVGVVLEGPVGAVIFWTFLGVAVETSKSVALTRHELARARMEADSLSEVFPSQQLRPAFGRKASIPS